MRKNNSNRSNGTHVSESAVDSAARPSAPPEWAAGTVIDRRAGLDRRDIAARLGQEPSAATSDPATGLERRRGPGRRRTDFTKAAEEGEMNTEQFLFIMAIEAFKKSNAKMFPTWTDVLEVIRLLGYRKTMPSQLSLKNAEDWREPADAPTGVRSKPGHPEEWDADETAPSRQAA